MPKFAVIRQDRTFVDLQGVRIHWYTWMPGKPKAIVLIVHGVGEHALRYEHVAQHLVNAGYGVAALDQRGHGATGLEQWAGDASRLGRLGPGGGAAVVGDVVALVKRLRGEHPGLPLGVVGHSWGSLTMQRFLNRHAPLIDAAVLSGTAYRVPGSMAAGDLNARHKHLGDTGYEWLSRDTAVQEAFAADPLTFPADVIRLFGPLETARLLGVPARHLGIDIPLLVAVGSDDTLGGEASARRLVRAYEERSRLTDVTLLVYPGARHEIFNEITKAKVLDDMTAWLDVRLDPERTGRLRGGSTPAP
jgi:alpha-beta hydrolase superfamily lysophospholipase